MRPAPESAYTLRSQITAMAGRDPIEVGQRVIHSPGKYGSIGLVIASSPTGLHPYGSTSRVFRVTDIEGLERRSFTPGWDHTGYCKSFLVAEELPLASAFGPHGADVLALVRRIERLTAEEVVALGELALRRGGPGTLAGPVGWEVAKAAGLESASSEADRRLHEGILSTAIATGDRSLYDEFQGCERYLDIVHPTWEAARAAAHHAVRATLLADAIEPDTRDAMTRIWRSFTEGERP